MISYQLILTSFVWILFLVLFWKLLRSRFHLNTSKKGLMQTKRKPEIFPGWYAPLYYFVIIVYISLSILFAFLFSGVIVELQKLLYFSSDMTIFKQTTTYIFALTPSFFLGLILLGILLNYVASFFPKFDHYSTVVGLVGSQYRYSTKAKREQVFKQALANVNLKKLTNAQWRPFLKFALVLLVVVGMLFVLIMDDYVAMTENGVVVNRFLELNETRYPFSAIRVVRISPDARRNSYGKPLIYPKFELEFVDNKKMDLWGGVGLGSPSAETLIALADSLRQKNIRFEIDALDSPLELNALRRKTSDAQEAVRKVFAHVEKF